MTIGKVGMYGGKFLPPHMGHVYSMIRASTMVDELHVIISYDEEHEKTLCANSKIEHIPFRMRLRWWMIMTKDMPHVHVHAVYEQYTNQLSDWAKGAEGIRRAIGKPIDVVFSSEHSYGPIFADLYPMAKHVVIDSDRSMYPISATKIRTEGPMKHWDMLPDVVQDYFAKKVVIVGTESCVDGDTEYFNGTEWKKISEYDHSDSVLQFHSNGTATLVKPTRFIKEKTDKLYKLSNSYGTWSQVFSEDHDIVCITSKGHIKKLPFHEVMKRHFENKYGFQGKFINHFRYDGNVSIDEHLLRLMIAVSADGSLVKDKWWRVRVVKDRKILRMRSLILAAGIPLDERVYEDGYTNFYIPLGYGLKLFPKEWMHLTKECKDIFVDELFRWDGHKNSYYSTLKHNVDVAQFIISSCGHNVHVRIDEREDKTTCYRLDVSPNKYTTMDINRHNEHHRHKMIEEYRDHDGYKYCFTVDSGMLVFRRDNKVFITGNCGKSTMVRNLAHLYNTTYVEEWGRTFYERMGNCDDITIIEDYPNIAFEHKYHEDQQLKKANKVLFIDTEAIVTQYYATLYLGQPLDVLDEVARLQKYDLWIFLEPDVKWVDDGTRTFGEQSVRESNNQFLKDLLEEFGVEYVSISGNYQERLEKAIREVNALID